MPRSRSSSIVSSTWGRCLRPSTAPVISRMRSASVDLPWSMWAMIEKLRMLRAGALTDWMLDAGPVQQQAADLVCLGHVHQDHSTRVDQDSGPNSGSQADDLGDQATAQAGAEE